MDTALWAPIVKMVKNDDGTMLVEGPITDAGLDRDQQKCDQAWLDRAVPQWFSEGGNIREMHTAKASGVAVEHERASDGTHWVKALVVDPTSVLKVEHKVLRGFSIGIKNARVTKGDAAAPGGYIVDGSIIETSLVDRPANPRALLALAKADGSGEQVPVEQAYVERGDVEPAADPETEAKAEDADDAASTVAATVAATISDVRARAQEVLDALALLPVPALAGAKADSATDIAGAQDAIAAIARLIQSEAEGLASGRMSEAGDIGALLEAVGALRWFIQRESQEPDDEDDGVTTIVLADGKGPDDDEQPENDVAPKTEGSDTGKADVTDAGTVLASLTKADLTALVQDAVAEVGQQWQDRLTKAEEDHEAALKVLRSELAEVKAMPTQGGPVRVRVAADKAAAERADAVSLLAQADEYDAKADTADDRQVASGYRQLARDLRVKASL